MELTGKVALVTGANGFVGSFITRRLREEGLRVRALVRRPEAEAEVVALGAEPVRGDATNPESVRAAVAGSHVVVHCAASASPDLAEAMRVNVSGTEALLEAARAAGCERLVHISTLAAYEMPPHATLDEDSPLVTEGRAYAVSKAEADRRVLAAIARGLPAVILRPPCILGVHPTSTWGDKVPRAIAAGQFPLAGDGESPLFYIHVRNLAEVVVLCLRSEAAVGQVFNPVDGQRTWRRYAEHFHPGPLPSVPESQAAVHLRFRGRFLGEKVQRVLGYTPRPSSFEEVLRETQRALAG
jgi:nucleoside-diphosphate-sugar epimerase